LALKIEKTETEAYERARVASLPMREENWETHYLILILDHLRLIALVTLLAMVAMFVVTKTWMTKWYQAGAIIEPVPEGAVENRVEGGMGGLGAGSMTSFLMASGIDSQAQEYLTILRSYTFNTEVAMKHNLTPDLLPPDAEKPATERKLKMKLFDILKGRFTVEYSMQAHNLGVHFLAEDPIRAQEILQFYLDDLRELQRQEAIKNAAAAIESLEKEADSTGDSLLKENLYALVARQVQRQKLAEVEADFAFKLLEAPISPDRPYWPRASVNCFLVMILVPLLMAGFIVVREMWRGDRKLELAYARPRAATEHSSPF
jgi:LPS O-antigen subunit length determinant protein (WzzB/FepE family)